MTSFEWYWWLTCVYRLEYFSSSYSSLIKCQQQDEVIKDEEKEREKDQSYYYDFNVHQDDISLQRYLDQAWSIPPPKEELEEECKIDKNDLTLCRLIITCILKHYSEQQKQSPNNYKVSFDELWNIQDNELNYFRHHHPAIQTLSSASLSWQSIPSLLQQHIKLYHFFETALYSPLFHQEQQRHHSTFIDLIPTFSLLEKEKKKLQQLFRSIFYREMANSFGLWEQQSNNGNEIDAVTDDLELLGYGIYPSAVYFNHSCHANVIKLRHGDQMHFYTKRDIQLNEELCISYGNVDTPFLERRQRLLDHYHFICQCQKCIQEEKDEKERKEKD
ncbi:hypothetical protein BJ944DRAFT_271057 [Cunninghamella echinulata]|nr:hypothetical protein BJ944DRAFT_271057 [Cunninghamella echinulata]